MLVCRCLPLLKREWVSGMLFHFYGLNAVSLDTAHNSLRFVIETYATKYKAFSFNSYITIITYIFNFLTS